MFIIVFTIVVEEGISLNDVFLRNLKRKGTYFHSLIKKRIKTCFFFSNYSQYTNRPYVKKLKNMTDFFSNYFTRAPDLLESDTKIVRNSSFILNSAKINEYFLDIIIQLKAKLNKEKSESKLN